MMSDGDTVTVLLSNVPQADFTRTQNCVGCVIDGVMSIGALPPISLLKSSF